VRLPLSRVRAGTRWLRIHPRNQSALWFGPAAGMPGVNRFDDPAERFRVCYLGTTIDICFAETFLRNQPVRILAFEDLELRSVAAIEITRDLRLAALHGPGAARRNGGTGERRRLRGFAGMVAFAMGASRRSRRDCIPLAARRFVLMRRDL